MADEAIAKSGIYGIKNLINGRIYVGSAVNIRRRWNVHKWNLKNGTHHSPALFQSWEKYGPGVFSFEILEIVDDRYRLIEREQFWIDKLHATDKRTGFNVSPTAGSRLGSKQSPEAREKMRSSSRKGQKRPPRTPEHCAAISAAKKGKPGTPRPGNAAHARAMGLSHKGKKRPAVAAARRSMKCPAVAEANRRRAKRVIGVAGC